MTVDALAASRTTSAGSRRRAIGLLACACAVAVTGGAARLSASAAAAAPSPLASAARTCPPPHYPGVGYFTSITVTGTTCSTATKLVFAYYKCRTRSGPAGKCKTSVLGFTCTETRNSIPIEIDARDSCRHGDEKVVSTWQQDIN